jgi:diguanylate cyclase (GGDEF)-like protein
MSKSSIPDHSPNEQASLEDTLDAAASAQKPRPVHPTDPRIVFPTIAVIVLALIWGTTLNLIKVEHAAAESGAVLLTRELAETYEAQVVRALREIDQTLQMVQYVYETTGKYDKLDDLKAKGLLPPDLLFTVSIADDKGAIVSTTRRSDARNVADQGYFNAQRLTDALWIGPPVKISPSQEWQLQFSRRLAMPDGGFAGVVMVAVDAAYFVSGYESAKLGEHGVLGILGTDGVFRVRRSGETVSAGERVDYAAVVPTSDESQGEATLSTNVWDDIRRYTTARKLYDFPLAVIVGLSEDEQLAAFRQNERTYLWRATAASALLLLIVAILGRMSRQLALSRRRVVEEQIAHAARVEYLAYHDGLTTLPNRSLFSKLLGQSIRQAQRQNRKLAVLFFDLDHFKNINDTVGHEAGDKLLQEVSTRLEDCLRGGDTVARMGGDEFVALLPELEDEKYVVTVAQRILAAVARPFTLEGQEFRVTASIGISLYPQDGMDEQTLERNADIAMYQVKEGGRNNFQFYSEELNASSLERLSLESSLRNALERNEFRLDYQAKRNISSGKITGVEALLRWQHPDLGTVAPMKFIPIVEETGLILPIGKWVLRTACMQNVAWQTQGLPPLVMAVNLTTRQFYDEELPETLTAIFAETGMDPHLLELEITESLLIRDVDRALRILKQLTGMGVRLTIDNFGLGYSSLSLLRQFPINAIKIDRSLIQGISSAADSSEQAEAIIALGRTLGQTIVAQGVETRAQADFLRKNSCDEFQGFYLNHPVAADQFAQLLRTQLDNSSADMKPAT